MRIASSLIRVFVFRLKNFASLAIQIARGEDSDQTAQMCSLIWIFAGRACLKVRLLTSRYVGKIIIVFIASNGKYGTPKSPLDISFTSF